MVEIMAIAKLILKICMESIDKFVQYCIKPKTYDTSNGSKYGAGNTSTTTGRSVGIGSGHSLNEVIIRNHEEIL